MCLALPGGIWVTVSGCRLLHRDQGWQGPVHGMLPPADQSLCINCWTAKRGARTLCAASDPVEGSGTRERLTQPPPRLLS